MATRVLLLWHMHQPRYLHPVTRKAVLPWVRLHAASGYLDMALALERRPGARVTVNFVPSLVEQLQLIDQAGQAGQAGGGATDTLEDVAARPEADLDASERRYLLRQCFSVRRDTQVRRRPRYAELLGKRGDDDRDEAIAAAEPHFSAGELRDAVCLFHLAWLGFAARAGDPAIRALETKARDFTPADKAALVAATRKAAAAVLPAWRRLAARGQVELASSPYYHPIVPLLIDSDVARVARPGDTLPPRFAFPGDAREHIRRAQAAHAATFGAPPRGMWPPEGSLSPAAVRLYAEAGVEWLAADEETLARSLDGSPPAQARARLWRHEGVDLVFRDRELSDRIGFRYATVPARDAAADLVASAAARAPGGLCGVFLDGENAWESYPGRGEAFLDALYARLEAEGSSATISEARATHGPATPLARLHAGSWIDAAFRIWIGDPVKNRAWTHLVRARQRVAAAEAQGHAGAAAHALDLLYAAEGSDWFWWYGEPFSSAEDAVFDELYRAHLAEAWRLLGEAPPAALADPVATGPAAAAAPRALISPRIDGKAGSFYDWQGALRLELGRGAAMAEGEIVVERVHAGADHRALYLRLDPARGHRRRLMAATAHVHLAAPASELTLVVRCGDPRGGPALAAAGGRVACQDVLELAVPFAALAARPRDPVRAWLSLSFAGVEFARVPRDGEIAVVVPWEGWEDENWTV